MTTDFHSHVLPGMDDGSASLEESLELLRMLARQGMTRVAATPHFYPRHQGAEAFLRQRQEAARSLGQAMAEEEGLPELILGAEVHYFSGIGSCDSLPDLTMGGKRYILVEMPYGVWSDRMFRDLEDISAKQDITPVIAHVDRYIKLFSNRDLPEKLMDAGALIQANASFFLTPVMAPVAMGLLQREQIHLLGSDCHNLQTRPPRIGPALEKIRRKLGQEAISHLDRWEQAVLSGVGSGESRL